MSKKRLKAEEVKAEEVKAEEVKAEEVKASTAIIAPRHALTSDKGILGPDTEVTPADLRGGQATFDHFVKTGHIVLK